MIKPAMTVTIREFPDDFIREITEADQLKSAERKDILSKWRKK